MSDFFHSGSAKFENRFGMTETFKMEADQRKMAHANFCKCLNFVNNSRNCTKFEPHGELGFPFDFSCCDLGMPLAFTLGFL